MESEDSSPLHKSHQGILHQAAWIPYTTPHPICLRSIPWHVLISLQQNNRLCTLLSTHAHYILRPPHPPWSKSNSAVQGPPWDVNRGLALKRLSKRFMEPKGSLPCLQESATKLYPRTNTSSPYPSNLKSLLILYSYSSLRIWSSLFPSGFPNDTLYAFIHSSMRGSAPPTHPPPLDRSSDSWLRIPFMKFFIIPFCPA